MKELMDSNGRRVTINTNYIVSIQEPTTWIDMDGTTHTADVVTVTTVDGLSHHFKGTYDEVVKELS